MASIPHLSAPILLVEDDAALAPLVVGHLEQSGFRVSWVADAPSAVELLQARPFSLVILDLMLPGEDGLSLCRRIRRTSNLGIVIVTARGEESDRIHGLRLGADDYLAKPFSLWELEARILAVLRRCPPSGGRPPRRVGPLEIDPSQRLALKDGKVLELTRSEFDILTRLMSEPGRVFTRDQLLECVQGGATDAFDRAVDTHVSNLRRKLGDDPRNPSLVKTVWGLGYRFDG